MKKILGVFTLALAVCSCNSTDKPQQGDTAGAQKPPVKDGTFCYAYTANKDSVWMQLEISGTAVKGKLTFNLFEKDRNEGTLSGTLKGDTLFADYKFQSEGETSDRDVIFLKKGEQWIEGYDKSESSGDEKRKGQLDFSGNIILEPVNCPK